MATYTYVDRIDSKLDGAYAQYHVRVMVHGRSDNTPVGSSSGCQCGSNPELWASFNVALRRPNNGTTVYVDFQAISVENKATTNKYGYRFQSKAGVGYTSDSTSIDGSVHWILKKETINDGTGWFSNLKTALDFIVTCTTTQNTIYIKIYAGGVDGDGCYNNLGNGVRVPCYGTYGSTSAGDGDTFLLSIPLSLPTYKEYYTLTYDNSGAPAVTTPKQYSVKVTYPTVVQYTPTYPFTINYMIGDTRADSTSTYRSFDSWYHPPTDTYYKNGDTLNPNPATDIIVGSIWKGVTFTPKKISTTSRIIFHTNGGQSLADKIYTRNVSKYTYTYKVGSATRTATYTLGKSGVIPAEVGYDVSTANLVASFDKITVQTSSLPTPTRSQYRFVGWYTDSNLTHKVGDTITISDSDVHLYAKWQLLIIKRATPTAWNADSNYVWKMTGTKWERVAPIWRMNASGEWENLSI